MARGVKGRHAWDGKHEAQVGDEGQVAALREERAHGDEPIALRGGEHHLGLK